MSIDDLWDMTNSLISVENHDKFVTFFGLYLKNQY